VLVIPLGREGERNLLFGGAARKALPRARSRGWVGGVVVGDTRYSVPRPDRSRVSGVPDWASRANFWRLGAEVGEHLGAHRIQMEVADEFHEVTFGLHHDGLVSGMEEVADALVAAVEGPGVAGEQRAHTCGATAASLSSPGGGVVGHQRQAYTVRAPLSARAARRARKSAGRCRPGRGRSARSPEPSRGGECPGRRGGVWRSMVSKE